MIEWGRRQDIQSQVAHVPDKWLMAFAIARPGDVRKFGDSSNSTLLFRSAAVLDSVENGDYFKKPADVESAGEEE